ncbi:MAG: ATP-binding protein [Rhodospirillaceae bacterium]
MRAMAAAASFGRMSWIVLALGAAAMLVTVVGAGFVIWNGRTDAIEQWKQTLANLSLVIAEHSRQSVKGADLVLKGIADRVNELSVEDDTALRRVMGSRVIFDMLRDKASGVPQIDVTTIVAANGDVINFSRSYPPPPINLADRDYFKAHFTDPSLESYLSAPVQNRGTGRWTFYLTRKIRNRVGTTIGLVLTGLHVRFFREFYEASSIGMSSAVSLFRSDGVMLARYPEREALLGTSFAGEAAFRQILANTDAGAAVVTGPRLAEGGAAEFRIIAPRLVKDYPLAVNITATRDMVLGAWRSTAWFIGAGALVFVMVLGALVLWIARLMTKHERARIDAEAANRAKSAFLAIMSHEIRTPITSIMGVSDLLSRTSPTEEQEGYLLVLRSATRTLLTILNDILDISKIEAGKILIEAVAFSLHDAIREVVELWQGAASAKGLTLDLAIAAEVPARVIGDPTRVKQVLFNLVSNAIKFTEHGSVRVSAGLEGGTGAVVGIAVEDTGIGLAEDQIGSLFTAFSQADQTTTRRFGGTGLGLAISKRLVELMGGEIGVESRPGAGTTFRFTVRFACAAAETPPPVPVTAASERPPPSLHILLAEDNRINQMLVRSMLQKLGHQVQVVENGRQALDAVSVGAIDVVLMDMQMPEMDGEEATRAIRALPPPRNRIPVLALTADVMAEHRERYLRAGVDDLIPKPIDWNLLADALKAHARAPVT